MMVHLSGAGGTAPALVDTSRTEARPEETNKHMLNLKPIDAGGAWCKSTARPRSHTQSRLLPSCNHTPFHAAQPLHSLAHSPLPGSTLYCLPPLLCVPPYPLFDLSST